MLLSQNLPTALPFYLGRDRQFFRTSFCKDMDDLSAIECRYDRLLPFIIKHTPAATPNYVYLVSKDGLHAIKIDDLITVDTETIDSVGYIYFAGAFDINTQSTSVPKKLWNGDSWDGDGNTTWADFVCDGGYFYLETAVGLSAVYQSELLHMVDFPEFSEDVDHPNKTRVRFECATTCPVAGVPVLTDAVSQKLFLNARSARPLYPFDALKGKYGNNEEKVIWAKIKKRFVVLAPVVETVADFLVTMPIYGTINFTDQYGVQSAITDVEVNIRWEDIGNDCVAEAEISFQRDFVTYDACC